MNEEIKIAEQAENAEAADNGDGNVEAVDNDNAASDEKLAKENARREEIQKYIDSLADKDVYDPNSYEVHLENFDGPLDLLWFLIRRSKSDISEIFVSEMTEQ